MQNKLVIDIGGKYLKLSVFGITPNCDSPVLLELVIRDIERKNANLLSRIINREYATLCTGYEISETIILPRRTELLHMPITVEYLNDKERMKKNLVKNINEALPQGDYISDWKVEDDNPEEDYYHVLASSVSLEEFKFISETMKQLTIRNYKIASPDANVGNLAPSDGRPYLILHFGHKMTTTSIVVDGICKSHNTLRSYTGYHTSDVISSHDSLTQDELYKLKNNATFFDLESQTAESEIVVFLAEDVKAICTKYTEEHSKMIAGIIVIGGMANLDIETFLLTAELDIPRVYPRLPVANHAKIPDNVRNYIYESACTLQDSAESINFTAPKDKSIGQYIKKITSFYSQFQVGFNLIIVFMIAQIIVTYGANYLLQDKVMSEQTIVSNYQSEISSLDTTVKSLESEYTELLDDKDLAIINYGEILSAISSIIPQGTFITEIRDATAEYLPETTEPIKAFDPNDPTTAGGPVTKNGLTVMDSDMLVALEIKGYTNVRYKAFDYALLLKELDTDKDTISNSDAVVTEVTTDEGLFQYTIHLIINK